MPSDSAQLSAWSQVAIAVPAHAEAGVNTTAAAQTGDIANSAAGVPDLPQDTTLDGASAEFGGGVIEVSTDPDDGISVINPTGTDISLGVPGDATDGVVTAGNVVYPDVAPEASVVARPTHGGAQALVVIEGDEAPTEYAFPVEVDGDDTQLRQRDDGTIEILGAHGITPAATIAPPWATDANGKSVPTRYEVRGSSVVQVVDHEGAAYPVVADPKYSWGYVTGTAYYNRAETRSLKTRSYAYVVAAGLCAAFGGATAGAACAVGAAVAAQWNYVASNAYGDGKCVKIKVPTMWAYAYSGGNCR